MKKPLTIKSIFINTFAIICTFIACDFIFYLIRKKPIDCELAIFDHVLFILLYLVFSLIRYKKEKQ